MFTEDLMPYVDASCPCHRGLLRYLRCVQDGVPAAIQSLLEARIKVYTLHCRTCWLVLRRARSTLPVS